MLLKVGAVSRSVVVICSIPPTSRHSSTAEFPYFHAHISNLSCPSYPARKPKFRALSIPRLGSGIVGSGKGGCLEGFMAEFDVAEEEEDLSVGGEIYRSTLRLVECSMFAALSGLIYFLSNSLSIENYFGCFFGLPIVISSMRWGISAGRKTMCSVLAHFQVATAVLLLVLSGPLKALTYLLMHGILGFSMGTLWSPEFRHAPTSCKSYTRQLLTGASWRISISICTLVRALCAMGYVLISSFLIRENILDLITINLQALLGYLFVSLGVNSVPSMGVIYAIFGFVLLLNSVFLVFLLHLLYSILLSRLGMKASLKLPAWLEKAL